MSQPINFSITKPEDARHNTHPQKWAHCSSCGWHGLNSELTQDGSAACGSSDDCPECGEHGFITCCYDTEQEAEIGIRNGEGLSATLEADPDRQILGVEREI